MTISDARKAANAKWDKANMVNLSCRVTKDKAMKFKKICEERGTNTNAVLLSYVNAFIKAYEEEAQEQS